MVRQLIGAESLRAFACAEDGERERRYGWGHRQLGRGWRVAVKVTVDYSRFRARLRRMREAGHTARSAFIFSMGQIFLQHVVKFSPVDTHRYVRGWLMASSEAGFKTTALPPLRKSRHAVVLQGLLLRQIMYTKKQITLEELKLAWYEDVDKLGRHRPKIGYYHKLVEKIYEAKERARRAASAG